MQDQDSFLNPCDYDPVLSPPVQFATYFISESNLVRLKQRLSADKERTPSATEAVCAFLWKHVVRARNIDCDKYPETKLSITVNTRSRMRNPVCSPAYWGNLSEPNAVSLLSTPYTDLRTILMHVLTGSKNAYSPVLQSTVNHLCPLTTTNVHTGRQ